MMWALIDISPHGLRVFFFEEWMGCRKETTPDIRLAIGRIESLSRIDVKATYINLILSI